MTETPVFKDRHTSFQNPHTPVFKMSETPVLKRPIHAFSTNGHTCLLLLCDDGEEASGDVRNETVETRFLLHYFVHVFNLFNRDRQLRVLRER